MWHHTVAVRLANLQIDSASPLKTISILALLLLPGCATPYQNIGNSDAGGFYAERISDNRFSVSFKGNGFTDPRRASDFVLLRAAEVALEYQYTYFTIDGQRNLSHVSHVNTGTTTTTTGMVSSNGNFMANSTTTGGDMPIFKPGSMLVITCYEKIPEGAHAGIMYTASEVAARLKIKYKIK